jgi:hypothetical protein
MQNILKSDGNISSHARGDNRNNLFTTEPTLATRTVTVGSVTYVGIAAIGTATSAAEWQIQKVDASSGVIVTWADGNAYYDNVWDNYASLTYS